jgi:transcription initiation factor TFIID subunit 7
MLLVDPASGSEPFIPQINGRLETDPYNFSHGLTPPLKHVRQRRFRKKLSKRVIKVLSYIDDLVLMIQIGY